MELRDEQTKKDDNNASSGYAKTIDHLAYCTMKAYNKQEEKK